MIKNNILKSTTKIVLAGAITLGTLGTVQLATTPVKAYADGVATPYYFEDFSDIKASYSSSGKDALRTYNSFIAYGNYSVQSNRFTITNTAGTVVHLGSLNSFSKTPSSSSITYNSITNISTASLKAGHYRIKVTTVMDDGRTIMSPSSVLSFTGAFTIDTNRNLTNFRP